MANTFGSFPIADSSYRTVDATGGICQALAVEFLSLQTGWHLCFLHAYQISHPNSICKQLTVVLRRVFGPKWDEVTGERRKLHNEELSDL
jgi:hypothetical protein